MHNPLKLHQNQERSLGCIVYTKMALVSDLLQGLENSVLSFGQFRVIFCQILRTAEIPTEFLR